MKGYYRHSLFGVLSAAVMSLVALASCSEEQGGPVNAADDYVELRMNVSTRPAATAVKPDMPAATLLPVATERTYIAFVSCWSMPMVLLSGSF